MARLGNVFNNKEDIKKEEQHPRRMIKWIHYTKLKENPGQYCPERDKEEIEALADLIEAAGEVIQNLSVSKLDTDEYRYFGTATTYDLVTEDGRFVGGVTSPGIRTSANALWQQAAKLPEIEIRKPQYILAKDTVTSMQGGLVYGYIGQTEYIIRKMKEESGLGKINVVATGGLGKMIAQETSFINYYDANLTLKGLQIIYDKQKQG